MRWLEEPHQTLTQGAIVDGVDWGMGENNPLSIILSNACDIENNKAEFLIVAALLPAASTLCESREIISAAERNSSTTGLTNKQKKSIKEILTKYINNTQVCRYFFFDPNPIIDVDLLLVDFQMVRSINIDVELDYIGQMKQLFTMQMMSRFVSYTGRVPVDRPEESKINQYIQDLTNGYFEL